MFCQMYHDHCNNEFVLHLRELRLHVLIVCVLTNYHINSSNSSCSVVSSTTATLPYRHYLLLEVLPFQIVKIATSTTPTASRMHIPRRASRNVPVLFRHPHASSGHSSPSLSWMKPTTSPHSTSFKESLNIYSSIPHVPQTLSPPIAEFLHWSEKHSEAYGHLYGL